MNLTGNYQSLWALWEDHAVKTPDREAVVHWTFGEEPYRWTYAALIEKANYYSRHLRELGVRPGDVCAIIMRHNKEFYPLYMGISGLGAIPAVLAFPNPRLHPDKFRQGIIGMTARSGLDFIFTQHELEDILKPLVLRDESTIKGLHYPLDWDDPVTDEEAWEQIKKDRASIDQRGPLLLQHSSGTTGLQKPVLLSHYAILRHVEALGGAMELSQEDKVVSWLPLYHDMGLIGAWHLPLAYGIPLIQLDPFQWVTAPVIMLHAASEEKATLAWLPNFAYSFMADRVDEEEMEGARLESLRMVINCSEPVRAESMQKFVDAFQPHGFNPIACSASYGLAEATFAVTQVPPGTEIKSLKLNRQDLSDGKVVYSDGTKAERISVSSGRTIDGVSIRVIDADGKTLPDGEIGELVISSDSLMDGYRNYPEKTAEAIKDGEYYSQDYGFILDGEVYIIGRKKDIIIHAGKNIYPEDIEDEVSKIDGIIPGRVIAFGLDNPEIGTEDICVIAETKIEAKAEQKSIRIKIVETLFAMDITVNRKQIYLVPSRWLVKSSAGKPARKTNKDRIIESGQEFGE